METRVTCKGSKIIKMMIIYTLTEEEGRLKKPPICFQKDWLGPTTQDWDGDEGIREGDFLITLSPIFG